MSGNLAGQTRALPFTGFATLPLVALGLILSFVGVLLTKVRPSKNVD